MNLKIIITIVYVKGLLVSMAYSRYHIVKLAFLTATMLFVCAPFSQTIEEKWNLSAGAGFVNLANISLGYHFTPRFSLEQVFGTSILTGVGYTYANYDLPSGNESKVRLGVGTTGGYYCYADQCYAFAGAGGRLKYIYFPSHYSFGYYAECAAHILAIVPSYPPPRGLYLSKMDFLPQIGIGLNWKW